MSKELIANLGVVSRCLSNAGYPKMSLIVEQASETLSHLPDREEVARIIREEVFRREGTLKASRSAADRILSLMERKA